MDRDSSRVIPSDLTDLESVSVQLKTSRCYPVLAWGLLLFWGEEDHFCLIRV